LYCFNPRASRDARLILKGASIALDMFQSTRVARRATCYFARKVQFSNVSIHARRATRDRESPDTLAAVRLFQSTRVARRATSEISSSGVTTTREFQSTRVARRATPGNR